MVAGTDDVGAGKDQCDLNPITGGVSELPITGGLDISTTTNARTLKLGQDMH